MEHQSFRQQAESDLTASPQPPKQTTSPRSNFHSQLGSGVITGELGEGGMAVVYEIWNEQLGVKRAVKVLKPGITSEHRHRFDTEIKLTARLNHPNIITVHSVGTWHGLPYIEMEKVDGGSLERLLSQRGALPVDVSVAVGLVIGRALQYTHSLEYVTRGKRSVGLLHRDLKPANILISRTGTVLLTDFGIATPVNVSMHTPHGSVVGSLQYIAPEQLAGEEIDARADIYSFGCLLYEMLTGFQAFPDRKLTGLVPKRLRNEFDPISSYDIAVPTALRRLIHRCLEHDPRKRPADMKAVCRELRKIYSRLTEREPETVIAGHISNSTQRLNFVPLRRRSSTRTFFATVAACAAAGLLLATLPFEEVRGQLIPMGRKLIAKATLVPVSFRAKEPQPSRTLPEPAVLLDSLGAWYGTDDPLIMMRQEEQEGNYEAVLALASTLSPRKARSILGVLLTSRALEATNRLSDDYFRDYRIDDAEYFLIKARWLYENGRYSSAIRATKKARQSHAYLLDHEVIHQQTKHQLARCRSALSEL
jgi:serine/threonine protein kinase